MNTDILELRQFYASPLGRAAGEAVGDALGSIWPRLPNERLVGLGYTPPYLERFSSGTERSFAFMPARQGACTWPNERPGATALVFEEELPLSDAAVDRVLMVHALEFAENPAEALREAWRVMAPNGRLVVVVPNRRGVWARFEHTPFGSGRPYSRSQITALLRETNFTPGPMTDALFFPPTHRRGMLRFWQPCERTGRRVGAVFAGVLIIEAQKRLYQGLPAARRASRRALVPALAPQGVHTSRGIRTD
ncbi:class I SAM-dependent methyltransferase [Pararhizobium mangrovi]|uniref:Class I SAM-dependent methyltransferase n=1 Tax=Pararhizobium mangrovi TaxID=2590452 RepID=A0A506U2T1_9HYPH|nr:class I SAM-dependent methyltransferase [Pararhizobium mangrovi]TPW27305.1 class I SAM-dependent methyltransferase [Pararhizobium mangrovi]